MSIARLDSSRTVSPRPVWALLLCTLALGIVGMCGLVQSGDAAPAVGHHVSQTVDMADPTGTTAATADFEDDESSGLLTLCLMVLVPTFAVGMWLLLRSRVGGWRLRREPVLAMRALKLAVPPQPLWRQLSVLRL
jgi:hypothetical protein